MLEAFRHYREVQGKTRELNYLFWECTLRCNLNCRHCGSDCGAGQARGDMPLPDFLKVLDSVSSKYDPAGVLLVLTGGEPLLREDLEECGKEFFSRGFLWGLVTNGYDLTARRLGRYMGTGLTSVAVSFDGLRDSHNWLRGAPDAYDRALNALSVCAESGVAFDAVTCVNRRNLPELAEMRRVLAAAGVKRWRLFTIFPKGRAKDEPMFALDGPQLRELLEFVKNGRRDGGLAPAFSCEGFTGPYEGEVNEEPSFCRAGINIGSVLADGAISACPSLRADHAQGNIYRDDFMDVWDNRFARLRDRAWLKTGKCAACGVFKWCGGGGLHMRVGETGDMSGCVYDKLNDRLQPDV